MQHIIRLLSEGRKWQSSKTHRWFPWQSNCPQPAPPKRASNHFRSMMASDISPSREDVREFLPDILGKALARTWIDADFRTAFDNDPCGTLESHGVFLPENMLIEFQRQNADRPRIVVYEQRPNSKFKARVLYLQLVMMAGR